MIKGNSKGTARWKWGIGAMVIGGLAVLAIYLKVPAMLSDLLKAALSWIQSLGAWGPAIFIAVYAVACVLFVPGSVLTLGAGILFGVVRGSLYTCVAATITATVSFLVGRHLARDWVAGKIQNNARFAALDKAVGEEGWRIVLLARLTPIFPFAVLNYGFSITRVSLRDYFFASLVGMIPATVMYVYLGSLIGDLTNLDQGVRSPPVVKWGLGILTIATVLGVTRLAKRGLAQRIQTNRPGQ